MIEIINYFNVYENYLKKVDNKMGLKWMCALSPIQNSFTSQTSGNCFSGKKFFMQNP